MNFLIVGANFINKGAESMLFTCVGELKNRFPECEIYYKTFDPKILERNYNFKFVYFNAVSQKIAMGNSFLGDVAKSVVKSTVKAILGRGNRPLEVYDLKRVISKIDCIIDVSGYCLTSKWGEAEHRDYFDNFDLATKYNTPIVLFPQSFGPFTYTGTMEKLNSKIEKYLKRATLIFAREREGKELLEKKYGITDIKQCSDLVLMTEKLYPDFVYRKKSTLQVPKIGSEYVGIIPNIRCLAYENESRLFTLYNTVIKHLLKNGKKVVIYRHAREDLEMCRKIKSSFADNSNVLLIENDFDCFETAEFTKQFEFIVAARYHSIVHAYRQGVPCVLFGWAVKYRELSRLFKQDKFVFDITDKSIDERRIISAIEDMLNSYNDQKQIILENLKLIRESNNCFDILEDYLNK